MHNILVITDKIILIMMVFISFFNAFTGTWFFFGGGALEEDREELELELDLELELELERELELELLDLGSNSKSNPPSEELLEVFSSSSSLFR